MKVITKAKDRKLELARDGIWITIRESSRGLRPGYTRAIWVQRDVGLTLDELRKILREAEAGGA